MSFEAQEGAAPHPKGLLSPHLEGLRLFPQTFQFVLSVTVFWEDIHPNFSWKGHEAPKWFQ